MDGENGVQLAQAFMNHYYTQFHGDRAQLAGLYRAESMLSLEGANHAGAQAIVAALGALPKCRCTPVTWDVQGSLGTGVIVLVNGNLVLESGAASKYAETFHIQPVPGAAGQFFIFNHVFRVQHSQ